jgi:uncharacterized OB-fold protein
MTSSPDRLSPESSPSPDAMPFWAAARRHEWVLPYCGACGKYFFYPRTLCPRCGSRDVQWRAASGQGTLYSFCIQYRNSIPGLRTAVPFVTALVDVDEGPRMMTFLIGIKPEPQAIRCGVPVSVDFLDLPGGQSLPVFRPAVGA